MQGVLSAITLRAPEFANAKRSHYADPKEIDELGKRLNSSVFDPLLTIYRELPICGVTFQFTVNDEGLPGSPRPDFMGDDYNSDTEHELVWMTPGHILFALHEAIAGPPIFAVGFLRIGNCSLGGDGYFIRFTHATDMDAPLYRVYYDWIDPDRPIAVPLQALKLVSHSLAKTIEVASIFHG